ncbi:MAG TPA: nucleoside monophosphate kinase [Elusimicrobiales bacterium]|nr:nucleoside monophosphate kinase [Elusimicrobiales bacterium]
MNIVLLGYPGAGKGTQARIIADKLNMVHVSFGDIFWAEIARKSLLGQEVSDYLDTGRLVPDWLILGQLKERFASERRGLLFDGFPRTGEQAEGLDAWLEARSSSLDAIVHLKLPEVEVAKRLEGRRVCGCGKIYNIHTSPPFMADMCDSCAGPLKPQKDDKPEVIKKRIMAYRDQTEHLLIYYRGNVPVLEVKADQPVQAVTTQLLTSLKTVLR